MDPSRRSSSKRILRYALAAALCVTLAAIAAIYGVVVWPLRDPHPIAAPAKGTLLLADMRVYTSPDAPALEHAGVLVRDGRIVAVGLDSELSPGVHASAPAEVIRCAGCTVTAGFWNAHVHFTQPIWAQAEWKPAAVLETGLESMLTSRGFTTVVDTGSNLRDTVPLRRRIESGELAGPRIYTAGAAQYPPNGIPYYLRDTLPAWLLWFLPQPRTPADAADVERRNIQDGADLLKLFTGSYVARGLVLPMPVENARAAVAVAHAAGQPAFAHESNAQGIRVALASGVDVLAHAADSTEGVDDALLRDLVAHHVAMIPTLKMFGTTVTAAPAYLGPIYAEVGRFHELGGDLLFGTDVGYMRDYDTAGEFEALARSGLSGRDILRMLGTAPAARFPGAGNHGVIVTGAAADLTVLGGDPIADPRGFADVRFTIRNGQVIWRHPQ
jgi:imidazolonepropionase-like amidohydrolase